VLVAWLLAAVWAAWLGSAQGLLAARSGARWIPDLPLIFLLALGTRVPREDLPRAGLAVALARCATSIEPPVALLAAYLGVAALIHAVRRVIDVSGPAPRALLAGGCALLVQVWLAVVHDVRVAAELARAGEHVPIGTSLARALFAWPAAISAAALALAGGAALGWFPGFSLLVRRRAWRVAASSR
jgi:hypothetical protein